MKEESISYLPCTSHQVKHATFCGTSFTPLTHKWKHGEMEASIRKRYSHNREVGQLSESGPSAKGTCTHAVHIQGARQRDL